MELGCSGQQTLQLSHSQEMTGLYSGVQESKLYNSFTFVRRKHEAQQLWCQGGLNHENGV